MTGEANLMRQALFPVKSYKDSVAYQRSNRQRVGEARPVWPLTADDIPSLGGVK